MFILTQLIFPSSKSTIELLEEGGNMFKSNNNNFIANLKQISHLFLVFQSLTLNKLLLAGCMLNKDQCVKLFPCHAFLRVLLK